MDNAYSTDGICNNIESFLANTEMVKVLRLDPKPKKLPLSTVGKIAKALESGKCVQSLHLDLSGGLICDAGLIELERPLQNSRYPRGLTLTLSDNCISYMGAFVLGRVLESENCPPKLTLDLSDNQIGDTASYAISKALNMVLARGKRKDFNILLDGNPISRTTIDTINGLIKKIKYLPNCQNDPESSSAATPNLSQLVAVRKFTSNKKVLMGLPLLMGCLLAIGGLLLGPLAVPAVSTLVFVLVAIAVACIGGIASVAVYYQQQKLAANLQAKANISVKPVSTRLPTHVTASPLINTKCVFYPACAPQPEIVAEATSSISSSLKLEKH